MNSEELIILNALVTYVAENLPGGLSEDEAEVARIVGRWAQQGVPVHPICPYCGSVQSYDGSEWLRWYKDHIENRAHAWYWKTRNKLKGIT